jgi:O-antigen/teichoic acid export membrane protein
VPRDDDHQPRMSSSTPAPPSDTMVGSADDDDIIASRSAGPRALRGSMMVSAGYAATVGLSLLSAPLLIRHLGIAEFGRYTTVISIVTIVYGLTDAGLVNVTLREWSTRTGDDRRSVIRSLLGLRLELSAAGVALGVGFAALAGYSQVLVLGTLLAGCGMVLQAISDVLTVALQGELRFGWVSIVNVSRQAVGVVLIIALVLAGAGLLPFFAVAIPAGLVTLVFTAKLVRGSMPLRPRLTGADRWPLIRETLTYAAAIAVNTIYFRVTIVVMSLIASAEQTGYFATSFRVTEVLVGIPALAVGAGFPILSRAARHDSERFKYASGRTLELALIAGTGMVLVVVLSAPFVIRVLAGPSGAPATPVLQIQGLALVSTFIVAATGFSLLSLRRHTELLVANGGALAANVALTLALIPSFQARGAAVAAGTAETCLALGLLFVLWRQARIGIGLGALRAVGVAGVAGAAPLLLPLYPILRALAGLAIYVALLALQRRLPPEIGHVLQRRQPR